MATRAAIAYQNSNGSIRSVYCHWDGYPEGTGKILLDYYSSDKRVRELISRGSISAVYPYLDCTDYHDPENPNINEDESRRELVENWYQSGVEYIYLWTEFGWSVYIFSSVYSSDGGWYNLAELLGQDDDFIEEYFEEEG